MRIVIDTNIILSALFFNGKNSQKLIETVNNDKDLFIVINDDIKTEYDDKIAELKAKRNIPLDREESYKKLISNSIKGKKESTFDVCRDKDDNKFIECAFDNKCVYIVSGDNDLLSLKRVYDIQIVKVADFLSGYDKIK